MVPDPSSSFNIYAFARPTTRTEVSALLREAIRLAEELDSHIDSMDVILQDKEKRATA